jgi:hypothetical protein
VLVQVFIRADSHGLLLWYLSSVWSMQIYSMLLQRYQALGYCTARSRVLRVDDRIAEMTYYMSENPMFVNSDQHYCYSLYRGGSGDFRAYNATFEHGGDHYCTS